MLAGSLFAPPSFSKAPSTSRILSRRLVSLGTQIGAALAIKPGTLRMSIFSKRHRVKPAKLIFNIPESTRSRLLYTMRHCVEAPETVFVGSSRSFERLLQEVEEQLLREYGGLCVSSYRAAQVSSNPAIEHFFRCDDDQVLDFVELCFRSFRDGPGKAGIEPINAVLREDGIGYELSPWVETEIEDSGSRVERIFGGKRIEITYPIFVRVNDRFVHEEIVTPCLQVLASKHFTVANRELLKAHGAIRVGDYAAAITACGAAFESTLKTICERKKWQYDKNRDTCANLIEVCRKNALFPEFYVEALKFVGTIRNRLGDAHGKGPGPDYEPQRMHAEHMLNLTSSHILFLSRISGLE